MVTNILENQDNGNVHLRGSHVIIVSQEKLLVSFLHPSISSSTSSKLLLSCMVIKKKKAYTCMPELLSYIMFLVLQEC